MAKLDNDCVCIIKCFPVNISSLEVHNTVMYIGVLPFGTVCILLYTSL